MFAQNARAIRFRNPLGKNQNMDDIIPRALRQDRTIDITTIGRKTGQPRRIEIWFHNLDDNLFITGSPGLRSWYANLVVNPEFTFHLKDSVQADLPARATPLLDEEQRRQVLSAILQNLDKNDEIDTWVRGSALVQVELDVN